ncbi:MAG: enoyl-CoA hydratase/isomerase family protein [Deltaproteobacteria bacterium]|nr:enoyl-CoA hydratase/isomerase family protein [Deltaproteobacteria bacterium]
MEAQEKNNYEFILVDDPAPYVRRITMNRPEKRNALNNGLRKEIFNALYIADEDESVRVTIIRGAGKCFSAGYDLSVDNRIDRPWFTSGGDGNWARHVVKGWFEIWDLAKPVIAQVHGFCLAGGSELTASCDLAYVSDDAQIGYPPIRSMAAPDMQYYPWMVGMRNAMEIMLTGNSMTGREAVEMGYANRCFPKEELEARTLEMAGRVAKIPTDLNQLNKRTVHRAMEIMGIRTAIRAGTEIHALGWYQPSSMEYMSTLRKDLNKAFTERDGKFGDYRSGIKKEDKAK